MIRQKISLLLLFLIVFCGLAVIEFASDPPQYCTCFKSDILVQECDDWCLGWGGCWGIQWLQARCELDDCWVYYNIVCNKPRLIIPWFSDFPCKECEQGVPE